MYTSDDRLPKEEAAARQERCRALLAAVHPDASGMLFFSRINIYYLTGTLGNGMLWLPITGEPVLLVRKGEARCRLESPLERIHTCKSYGELPGICAEEGAPLGSVVAVEMEGLPWSLANLLRSRLKDVSFVDGSGVALQARSVKSAWELALLAEAGARHRRVLTHALPERLRAGMTERAVAHAVWELALTEGHGGMQRMGHYGEESFLGHVAAGDNGNYPGPFNSPLGFKGEHPAMPFMGYAGSVWRKGSPLMVDTGFMYQGYHTDMSVTYWCGAAAGVPLEVRRAQEVCAEIFLRAKDALKPGNVSSDIWRGACVQAADAGYAAGFMGVSGNKVRFLGHGIGLVMDEAPVLAESRDVPLEEGMVLALEPKIGLPGVGMVGLEHTCVVTPQGGRSLTGEQVDVLYIED